MKESLLAELNKSLSNSESLTMVLNKAIQLAESDNNDSYVILFTHHLNGLDKNATEQIKGSDTLAKFSSDRMKSDGYYLIGSISRIESDLHSKITDIQSYLTRAEEHTKASFSNQNSNPKANDNSFSVQQGVFAQIIANIRKEQFELEEIISRIRSRVMLYSREYQKEFFRWKKIKTNQNVILRELFTLFQKQEKHISLKDLALSTEISFNELADTMKFLNRHGLVEQYKSEYFITEKGVSKVKTMNKTEAESSEQKRFRVLKMIYDLSEGSPSEPILYDNLEYKLQLNYSKIEGILRYLEQRRLIKTSENWVEITSEGIDEIEKTRSHPENPTPYFPANIYNNTYHAPITGIQQGGQHNTQNIVQNINPDFTQAISDLLNLIENSSLSQIQKINTKSDVQIIKGLADLEKTPEVKELATSKIEAVKEVISMTADMTSLGMIIIPILQAAFGG